MIEHKLVPMPCVFRKESSCTALQNACPYQINNKCLPALMDNIKQETQRKVILATEFDPEKYHLKKNWSGILYEVHLVNNGKYLTIDQRNLGEDDLGYFYITEDEYDLFRRSLKEVELQ